MLMERCCIIKQYNHTDLCIRESTIKLPVSLQVSQNLQLLLILAHGHII
jgi:hypothetical protein